MNEVKLSNEEIKQINYLLDKYHAQYDDASYSRYPIIRFGVGNSYYSYNGRQLFRYDPFHPTIWYLFILPMPIPERSKDDGQYKQCGSTTQSPS